MLNNKNQIDSEPNQIEIHFNPEKSEKLISLESKIISTTEQSIKRIQTFLPIKKIQIYISNNPSSTIPEIGLGGYCPDSNTILISLNPDFPKLIESIENELIKTIAHEAHHAMRWQNPGYGETLFEACITEGLADHFQIEVTGGNPPIWSKNLTYQELTEAQTKASTLFHSNYDHDKWFFTGSIEENIPRWTGYSLGFKIAGEYLKLTSRKPSQLFKINAQEIYQSLF